jgi:hypothetical protein
VANRVKISVWPLLDRARTLRRDAARLVRQLGKTSEEIKALRGATQIPKEKTDRSMQPKKEKPR